MSKLMKTIAIVSLLLFAVFTIVTLSEAAATCSFPNIKIIRRI